MRKMFLLVAVVASTALFTGTSQADAARYRYNSRHHYHHGHHHGGSYRVYSHRSRYTAPRYYAPYRGRYHNYYRGNYGRYQPYGRSGFGVYTPGFQFNYWR